MASCFNTNLKKSKSVDSLCLINNNFIKCEKSYERFRDYFTRDNHSRSDLSYIVCFTDDGSEAASVKREQLVSGVKTETHDEGLMALDNKIENLNRMLQEQHLLLKALKQEIISPKCLNGFTKVQQPDLLRSSTNKSECVLNLSDSTSEVPPSTLLETIKVSQVQKIDREIREALIDLLKCDDLKSRIASATAESMKEVISRCFSETFPSAYLPIMEQSHRKLLKHVTKTLENAFNELEAGTSSLFKSVHQSSNSLRTALEKHQVLVETNKSENLFDIFQATLEIILKNEFKEWREKVLSVIKPKLLSETEENSFTIDPPTSPPQPADPERSIIDQLMKSAEINKQIKDGDINKSFEDALSSSDLSLVMAACRAADPQRVFTPCCLSQSVLLSLVQQLATDMVHDTQLKCRYLEEAIINLNTSDQNTRVYLPLVVGEVRKHLSKFLQSFPCHVASRRITLIIMAADNLLK